MAILRSEQNEIADALRSRDVERAEPPEAEPDHPESPPNLSSLVRTSRAYPAPRRLAIISDFGAPIGTGPEHQPQVEKPLEALADEPTSANTCDSGSLSEGLAQGRGLIVGAELSALTDRIAELEKTCGKQARQIEQLLESTRLLQESTSALAGRCDSVSERYESLSAALAIAEAGLEEANRATEARLRSEIGVQGTVLANLVQQRHQEVTQDLERGLNRLENEEAGRLALAEVLEMAARTLQERHTGGATPDPQGMAR